MIYVKTRRCKFRLPPGNRAACGMITCFPNLLNTKTGQRWKVPDLFFPIKEYKSQNMELIAWLIQQAKEKLKKHPGVCASTSGG